jgi:hypothetical protein
VCSVFAALNCEEPFPGRQSQTQLPPQQPPLGKLAVEEPEEDFAPFEGAAKTESWTLCFALAQFGHSISAFRFITMRS